MKSFLTSSLIKLLSVMLLKIPYPASVYRKSISIISFQESFKRSTFKYNARSAVRICLEAPNRPRFLELRAVFLGYSLFLCVLSASKPKTNTPPGYAGGIALALSEKKLQC